MQHEIVSQDAWLTARKALFEKERAMTHALDELRAERRQLPWVRVEKSYIFEGPDGQCKLDDLFGIRYVGEDGSYQPGKLAAAEAKKLPANAAALVQQLALWLPADGRLLWQLMMLDKSLANLFGMGRG